MTDQQPDERIALEDIPLTLAVEYVNPEDSSKPVVRRIAGKDPFILFEMKQEGGAIVADITASCIPEDQDLIETLEVFLTALVEERANRLSAEALRAVAEMSEADEDEVDEFDSVFDLPEHNEQGEYRDDVVGEYLDEELTRANEDATLRDMGAR